MAVRGLDLAALVLDFAIEPRVLDCEPPIV